MAENPHHHFDAEGLSHIDTGSRGKWLRVDDLIIESGVTEGMTCIDLGCGGGAMSIPLAEKTGKQGKVYAVDVSERIIQRLNDKNPPENLVTVFADASETGLESEIADYCFIVLVLHELEPAKILDEAFRLLKPGGRVISMEWRTDNELIGPRHGQKKISKEEMEQLYKQAGFSNYADKDWTKGQYISTGIKE